MSCGESGSRDACPRDDGVRVVQPCAGVQGRLRVPGDKSISHRLAMLTALASGESRIENFLRSEDCLNTLRAVEQLGATVRHEESTVVVRGTSGVFRAPEGPLDLGNSGTGMRLLSGVLAGQPFCTELTGDASLRSRDMGRIRQPLELMGAGVELLGEKNRAPIRVTGGDLRGIDYAMPVASAQVKSCILLAGLSAEGTTVVREPKPTRDHTERLLSAMGAPLEVKGLQVSVRGSGGLPPRLVARERWTVPGDFSSASFWIAAGACRPGSEIVIEHVGLNPRRTALLGVLRRMGAAVEVERAGGDASWEAVGTVRVRGGRLRGTVVEGEEIPNLIDELPLVSVLGALAEGETTIRDAEELRAKESDRIATMVRNLGILGVMVDERPDGLTVRGAARIPGGGEVDSYGDHRVAMAMAILGLSCDAPVRIMGTSWVSTSYPGFWDQLEAISGRA